MSEVCGCDNYPKEWYAHDTYHWYLETMCKKGFIDATKTFGQPLSMASQLPLARMVDEFGFPQTTLEVEKEDLELAKRIIRRFREGEVPKRTSELKDLDALLGRLP